MSTVFLKNINPLGDVDLPLVGQLKAGEVFEIDAALAGRAPSTSTVVDEATGDEVEVIDPGEGLLAQVGNYELTKPPKATKATTTDAQEG